MSSGAWLETDLLRQRREVLGERRPTIVPVRTLLVRGSLIGASLPLVMALLCLWLWLVQMRLSKDVRALESSGSDHDKLELLIAKEKIALNALLAANQTIARAIVDVRSSSALLSELRLLIPTTVGFDKAKIAGNTLEIEGKAAQPNGLRSINALMLSLNQSGLFNDKSVVLEKAQSQSASLASGNRLMLGYAIKARFSPQASNAIRPRLMELGAVGLAERVRQIQRENDLLP